MFAIFSGELICTKGYEAYAAVEQIWELEGDYAGK
jgi:hypothetical protein